MAARGRRGGPIGSFYQSCSGRSRSRAEEVGSAGQADDVAFTSPAYSTGSRSCGGSCEKTRRCGETRNLGCRGSIRPSTTEGAIDNGSYGSSIYSSCGSRGDAITSFTVGQIGAASCCGRAATILRYSTGRKCCDSVSLRPIALAARSLVQCGGVGHQRCCRFALPAPRASCQRGR